MQSSSALSHSQSFHPIFTTTISQTPSPYQACSLNLLYALPPLIFIDPYELANRAVSYSFQHAGPSNLELPVAAFDPSTSNSSLLLTVGREADSEVVVELPLHVRYGPVALSKNAKGFIDTEIPWPKAFYACPASADHELLSSDSPLPIMPPSFTTSFASQTIHLVPPASDAPAFEVVHTPVGNAADVRTVELGTAVVIIVCFLYLLRAMQRTFMRLKSSEQVEKEKVE
ncbi:RBR-type E3 ubiquitin transferase [Mycena indigotica]|uniref:Protein PBN1 n=1 Tax=Mycena indigotica TaxID=2126181 RepID=A0A8H6TG32_9AGAR|nr:RBR-type E3 ubiquitin transferase [Mycena indigotica]KAF7316102.1 RBR-type E3 ubiquitin transferase [Mycena indigotica]